MRKYLAEMIGTMILVLMGCGSAVFAGNAAGEVSAGVGTLGVALAFGLSVVAMAYTIGNISGCHINPAITLGVWLSGKMTNRDAIGYMIFQIIGAIIGSLILLLLVSFYLQSRHSLLQILPHGFLYPSLPPLLPPPLSNCTMAAFFD